MTYIWMIPTIRCPNCGASEEGIRILLANVHDGIAEYAILCTNCHTMIVAQEPEEDFWRLMRDIPPMETED